MKKALFLFIVMFGMLAEVQAQMYNIYVRNADGKALEKVKVYTFPIMKRANAAYQEAQNDIANRFDKKKHELLAEGETDASGLCVIQCSSVGSIILDGGDCISGIYEFKLYAVEDYRENELDYTLDLVLGGQDYIKKKKNSRKIKEYTEFANKGNAEQMDEVLTEANLAPPPTGGGVDRHGKNSIRVRREIDIEAQHAKDDGRFVAFPVIHFHDYKDSVVYMPPAVVDGEHYANSMERRMSFEKKRDRLDSYHFDASTQLKDHRGERILYLEYANISKGTKYHIPGIIWYEDYNGVYHKDSLLFSDGKECEPMRFLNWDDARKLSPIDRTLFSKRPSYDPVKDSKAFPLQFEQGDKVLNLRDSVTVAQRDQMMSWIDRYYSNKEGEIIKIVVKGYSSPEGSEKRNRELSHDRARTIQDMLKRNFTGVKIETEFDQYDNIVPWEVVADTMVLMEDTIAHRYADQIRAIVESHKGFDAQYRIIRANAELYNYLDNNVLHRVRRVDIETQTVVQRILSKEEIVARFESNPEFRSKMVPYQYYIMMCHLADEEKWEELYEVAKGAYENCEKENVTKQVRTIRNIKDTVLTRVEVMVPYPLAAYYLAVATMRRGNVDTEILKPYLDDGPVGNNRKDTKVMNSLPFVVAQVLMYCQDEDFDGANKLIEKYNLISVPELEGLIMFVRCLDGQYRDDEKVRRYVMNSSEMNRAVIYAAMGKYKEALTILYSNKVDNPDAKVEYLKAICKFRSLNGNMTSLDKDAYTGSAVYNYDGEYGIESSSFAYPMLEAFKLDKNNVKYLDGDGYFNNAYRQMMLYFWNRYEKGVSLEVIAKEYDALVKRMRTQNEITVNK